MPARVMLIATAGSLAGQKFVFDGHTVCTVGRSPDCLVHLPSDPDKLTASRHHCELAIDPPKVCVRDLNSRNGTYVNGESIGRRSPSAAAEEPAPAPPPPQPLRHGDQMRVGRTIFRVAIRPHSGSRRFRAGHRRRAVRLVDARHLNKESRDE